VVNLVRYYVTYMRLGIRQPLRGSKDWEFFCDSDLGGNAEPINKRRSQMGGLAIQGEAPMLLSARVTTVALAFSGLPAGFRSEAGPVTAHPAITAEHATTSSAESETYALALFANDLLALSYVVDEAGLVFPRPAVVLVDNTAAIAFSRSTGSTGRSRMRHIDLRQAWVLVLRESGLITCVHVDTKNQLADIFTKFYPKRKHAEWTKMRLNINVFSDEESAVRVGASGKGWRNATDSPGRYKPREDYVLPGPPNDNPDESNDENDQTIYANPTTSTHNTTERSPSHDTTRGENQTLPQLFA
jgi:hypothetical protein